MSKPKLASVTKRPAALLRERKRFFEKLYSHKRELLDVLHEKCPSTRAFDKEGAWQGIVEAAELQLSWRWAMKYGPSGRAQLSKSYKGLADVLKKARQGIVEARRSGYGGQLFSAWQETSGDKAMADMFRDFRTLETGLGVMEAAAMRAAEKTRPRRGRPKRSSALMDFAVYALAAVYREATGLKAGAGKGPFSDFVDAFQAVADCNLEVNSVIEAIKIAARTCPGWFRGQSTAAPETTKARAMVP